MNINFKKIVSVVSIVLLSILIIYSIHIIHPKGHLVDCSADVISIKTDAGEQCLYVIASESINNMIYEIKIPYGTKCKTVNGDKFSLQNIKIGDNLSLNFKGEPEHIDGVNYAVAKGTIVVAIKTNRK